ncbi:protein kinase domain-containing protein, partial [Spirulina sp. 06S082]|uniref:protein kinase domain-containing protein n=1 Tax=Spirulina sp. 06S082 TaxID=3110248 RepID=UPI002B21389F
MNISLPGYQIFQTVHQGNKTVIYRGKQESNAQPIIIKTLKAEYPTLEEITRLRHEHRIIESLESENIIKAYDLLPCQHGLALILEEFGGVSLKQLISDRTLSIDKFLEVAIILAQ